MSSPAAPVSVVVTTVDRPASLARCLDALRGGTVAPAEIVVVDQGATPAPALRPWPSVPIVHVRQEPLGLSAARNLGAARSRSPVVAVTDDDCVPASSWVHAIGATLARHPTASAVTGPVLPAQIVGAGRHAVSSRTSLAARTYAGRVAPWVVGTGANFAVRREELLRVGGWDERLGAGSAGEAGEDVDLLYRLLAGGATIHYVPDALVRHELQTRARKRATRSSYGHGIGAFCGLRLRARDSQGLVLLGCWLALRTRLASKALVTANWATASDERLVVLGTFQGLRYAATVSSPKDVRP